MRGTHPNPPHAWGQGSLESFQPQRSRLGRNMEVSPLMRARKTCLASSQSQGSQALANAAALPGEAASPALSSTWSRSLRCSGGWVPPSSPWWRTSLALWPAGWWPRAVPGAQHRPGLRLLPPARGLSHWPGHLGCGTRSSSARTGAGEAGREQPGGVLFLKLSAD